jgi:propionyl-CoA carboxylase alpha chain
MKLPDKILIANRGEIAVRIARTCRRLGLRSVAVCSEIDRRSPHVAAADESICIGGSSARESYLDAEKILSAARQTGCQAIHPGYGFLSENPDFARRVDEAGLLFIGPPAAALALLGDKLAAKALAAKAGAPVTPASLQPLGDDDDARRAVEAIGLPVLLKPAAGGGGRGMRIVRRFEDLAGALASAREEVRKSFGDDRIYAERYIPNPRHIEVQIAADRDGRVIHLGERECSVQRRHQKIIEESPSPAVDEALRQRLGGVAVAIAKAADYRNLGTMEFLLSPDGEFYFLETNTRLQVEHTVTEAVTGLDLVEWQIRLAAGEPLPLAQDDIALRGWAIEARICAEDPARGFLPTIGMITRYAVPGAPTSASTAGWTSAAWRRSSTTRCWRR